MKHELKTAQPYFEDVIDYKKKFEVRKNDRNFQVGDILSLREYVQGRYTYRECARTITYILDNPEYVKEGYVILGME